MPCYTLSTMTTLACLICTKDRPEELATCALASIERQTRPPDELVVAYAGSEEAARVTAEFATRNPAVRVRCIRCEPGLTRQRNAAIDASTADILFFLDDDIRLEPDCISEILSAFARRPTDELIAVNPMIIESRMPCLSRFVRKAFLLHHEGRGVLLASGCTAAPFNRPDASETRIEFASGCCAYRRAVFDVERFDTFFSGYGYMEDLEFSLRARRHGGILLAPRAIAHHLETPSARTDRERLARMMVVNHWYVAQRHLPHDWPHRLCFAWSEFGNAVLYLVFGLRRADWSQLRGWRQGIRDIRRGALPRPARDAPDDPESA